MNTRHLLLCAVAALGACTTGGTDPNTASITGTATYRERMMPPPNAVLEVLLEDVSRADAPAEVIARNESKAVTAPPFAFTLPYDPSRINSSHRYHVRARITADGQLLFQSDAGYAVLGAGNVSHIDILLKRTSADTTTASSNAQQLRGLYSYMADAAWFVDCRSGVRLAVAQDGDNAALEVAYIKAKPMDGAQMLATVEGRVEDRTPMEGSGTRPTLIVEKFVSIESEGCSGPASTAQLENTYWKLMTLGGNTIETREGARETHFVLDREQLRIRGYTGCNGMSGTYKLRGEELEFVDVASTMMACEGDMSLEPRMHEMLSRVARWKIAGETLQLLDASGAVLATFESRYMK